MWPCHALKNPTLSKFTTVYGKFCFTPADATSDETSGCSGLEDVQDVRMFRSGGRLGRPRASRKSGMTTLMMKHNIDSRKEDELASLESFEPESFYKEEVAELIKKQKKPSSTRRKQTPSREWKEQVAKDKEEATTSCQKERNLFQRITDDLKIIRVQLVDRCGMIREAWSERKTRTNCCQD